MKNYIRILLIAVVAVGCKDPFEPPVTVDQISFLTVDGMIDATDSTAIIKLSRALKLSSSELFPIVDDATVSVEEENGVVYSLPYLSEGIYQQTGLTFSPSKNYRVRITTSIGKKYSSAFVPLLSTPGIDTIQWQASQDGVSINVSSKEDAEASRHYRWNFIETWQYNSTIASILEIKNGVVILRPPEDQNYTCWLDNHSKDILIKSTNLYDANKVNNLKLTFLPVGTPKLTTKYSLLVQQVSISEAAYNFLDQLKKATQSTGGLFDPLPSQVFGNISNDDDPDEVVLGFFSASSVSTKRMFIANYELPVYLQKIGQAINCRTAFVPFEQYESRDKSLEIIGTYGMPITLGYTFSTKECVDCRYKGGTNIRPSFWN